MNLVLVRGLPGSGKSTLAKAMAQAEGWHHIEADMFFMNQKGHYVFDKSKIREAHKWCQMRCRILLEYGDTNIIVSNTFCEEWEVTPYRIMALNTKACLSIITLQGDYGNIHNVPDEALERMKARFDWNLK